MVTETNLYGVYVGGDRRDRKSEIEIRAVSRHEAKRLAREWLGDRSGALKLSARLKIRGYSFHPATPPTRHPLYQSAA